MKDELFFCPGRLPALIHLLDNSNDGLSHSHDFKAFGDSCVLAVKAVYTDYFSNILHEDPTYFDQHIMGNQVRRVVGKACLLGIENNKPADGTGPPIDVLVVTKKGEMWIRK